MKFNSKLLLEELIRTHILEAAGDVVVDMNVNRGKPVGKQGVYGYISSPGSGTSSVDKSMFDNIIQTFFANRRIVKRPYLKIYTDVKGKTAIPESERISVLINLASSVANEMISKFGEIGDGVDQYDAIISNPQKAKLTSSSNSTEQEYSGTDKLYYTIVYLRKTDINDTITPDWGTNRGIKYYSQDQIPQLAAAVKPEPEVDDASSVQINTSRELTTKNQLTNIGFSTDEKKKNLQRVIYSWWQANSAGASTEIETVFQKFKQDYDVNVDPVDWNGIITTNSDVVEIIKNFYNITDNHDFIVKLQTMSDLVTESLKETIRQKIKNFRKSKLIEQQDEDTPNPWSRTNEWWLDVVKARSQAETEKAKEEQEAEAEQKASVLSDNPEIQKTDIDAVYNTFSNTYEQICADLKNFFEDYDQFEVYKGFNDREAAAWKDMVIRFLKESIYPNFKLLTTILNDLDLEYYTNLDVFKNMGSHSANDPIEYVDYDPQAFTQTTDTQSIENFNQLDLPIQRMIQNYIMLKSNIFQPTGMEWSSSYYYYNYIDDDDIYTLYFAFTNPTAPHLTWTYQRWYMNHWGPNLSPVEYFVGVDF